MVNHAPKGRNAALSPKAEKRLRDEIDGLKLIHRLQDFVHATITYRADGAPLIEAEEGSPRAARNLTKEQLMAAKLLLDRVVPPMPAEPAKPEETRIFVLRAPPEAQDAMEWLNKYGPKTIEHKERDDEGT